MDVPYHFQSEEYTAAAAGDTTTQNVKFSDCTSDAMVDLHPTVDPIRKARDTDDASLEHFFRRPVNIGTIVWSQGGTLFDEIDPWFEYFSNARVQNRLTNFKLMRANMRVKIVINGNSFFYGRAMVGYNPYYILDGATRFRSGIPQDIVQLSQKPRIFLDPTESAGGEMLLPFIWHYDYLDVPGEEWSQGLGALQITEMTPLKHANGANENVTINVFAWAEDVQLVTPTSRDIGVLAPQSDEYEEVEDGKISTPATAVAKMAGAMSTVPVIGPYARATEVAAKTVAAVAKQFGYSAPTDMRAGTQYYNEPMGNICCTNLPDQSIKLTVDSKQEVSIDPRITGINTNDELTIKSIAQRESYLTQFVWSTAAASQDFLWNCIVDPCLMDSTGAGPTTVYYAPACAIAALPFEYWTGSIKFRFQIVASGFHRGRLKVSYDPEFIGNTTEYNTMYTEVIDISSTKDFTMEIGPSQVKPLMKHIPPGLLTIDAFDTNRFTNAVDFGNGVLGISVVNELTSPNTTVNNDIYVNVFVSAGSDFEVFVPGQDHQFTLMELQSHEEEEGADTNDPIGENISTLGLSTSNPQALNSVYTGECISSFRQLLKRYMWYRTFAVPAANDTARFAHSIYPLYRGSVPGAIDTTATASPYNYVTTNLMNFLIPCFAIVKGGTRWKSLLYTLERTSPPIQGVERTIGASVSETFNANYPDTILGSSAGITRENFNSYLLPRGTLGSHLLPAESKPVLEFEQPYYTDRRFSIARVSNRTTPSDFGENYQLHVISPGRSRPLNCHLYLAAAEDFDLRFWVGAPPFQFSYSYPAPTL
jgi:hypothetical protein